MEYVYYLVTLLKNIGLGSKRLVVQNLKYIWNSFLHHKQKYRLKKYAINCIKKLLCRMRYYS